MRPVMRIGRILKKHNIAFLESDAPDRHVYPKFKDKENEFDLFAEFSLIPYNQRVLDEIVHKINRDAKGAVHENPQEWIRAELVTNYDEKHNRYQMVIVPDRDYPRTSWLEETRKMVSHISRAVQDYDQKYHHRKPKL